jgi:hypothetical protein
MDIEFLANKLQITEGLTLVYGNDNKSYWYTGLTSVGDESAVGFVLVDTRTKETIFYKQGGATEMRLKVRRRESSRKRISGFFANPYIISGTKSPQRHNFLLLYA